MWLKLVAHDQMQSENSTHLLWLVTLHRQPFADVVEGGAEHPSSRYERSHHYAPASTAFLEVLQVAQDVLVTDERGGGRKTLQTERGWGSESPGTTFTDG